MLEAFKNENLRIRFFDIHKARSLDGASIYQSRQAMEIAQRGSDQ